MDGGGDLHPHHRLPLFHANPLNHYHFWFCPWLRPTSNVVDFRSINHNIASESQCLQPQVDTRRNARDNSFLIRDYFETSKSHLQRIATGILSAEDDGPKSQAHFFEHQSQRVHPTGEPSPHQFGLLRTRALI